MIMYMYMHVSTHDEAVRYGVAVTDGGAANLQLSKAQHWLPPVKSVHMYAYMRKAWSPP